MLCSFSYAQTENNTSDTKVATEQEATSTGVYSDIDLTQPTDVRKGNYNENDNFPDGCLIESDGCLDSCLDVLFEPAGLILEAMVGIICIALGGDVW